MEIDAAIQDERAVHLISTQVKTAGGVYATAAETALRKSLDDVAPPAMAKTCAEIKFTAFVLNSRVDLHAIDATPARWRDGAGSSPTHWLMFTQVQYRSRPLCNASGRPIVMSN